MLIIRQVMKKYIYILNAINVMAKLLKDKRVEGVLYLQGVQPPASPAP